ncbi:unnamed protein product [Effrenium voratum]|uniref:NUP210 Ig-like domain-containing protein n=1 Tax=Effrenium voratum TaxID=2562239 RepID=A0AA36MJB1_9DINO|nr:unnamed protein product [Effrenium voratum]
MGRCHVVLGLVLAWVPAIAEPKISVVTALLPARGPGRANGTIGAGARLRVEASGGCFRWVSQRPDLVAVEEPLHEELPPRRPAEAQAEAACQEACLHAGRQFLLPDETTPADDGCQPVAIIRSLAESVDNVEKVLVLAQDINSPGVELRCEVYIASIERIEVETSVRRINVDDVETLGVKAYDKQGNVFSSLEGLQFRWRIGDSSVLKSPKLVDSAFKLSPVRRFLAEAGVQPDTVLLQGISTGRTTVGANLTIDKKPIVSPEVLLTVLENIVVIPSLLLAPPMAHLQLQLKVLRGPRRPLEEFPPVQLPVEHFRWHVQPVEGGEDVLYVQPEMGRVVTQRLGSGRVLAVDGRIENNTAASVIHVSQPASLRFWTQPLWHGAGVPTIGSTPGWLGSVESGWEEEELHVLRSATSGVSSAEPVLQLVQGRTYALKLELLDKNSQLMQIPLNLRAGARCEAAGADPQLQLLHQASNSAVFIFRAVELGEGHIIIKNLTLQADDQDKARGRKSLALKLMAKQAFVVAPQLRPVVPVEGPMLLPRWHSYLLQVVGGSGRQVFAVHSQPAKAISVSPNGRVQAFGQLATGELSVHDERNPQNNLSLPVLVRRAGRLLLQPRYLQILLPRAVTKAHEEPVWVRARPEDDEDADVCEAMCRLLRNLTFWNCSALFSTDRLVAEVSNRSVASVSTNASSRFATCALIFARPLAVGRFQLSARAQEADAVEPLPVAPLPFEVYKPVEWQLLDVKDLGRGAEEALAAARLDQSAALVVAPCSSIRLRLSGGPRSMNVPGHHSWNLTVGPHISVQRLSERSFQVTCMQVTSGPVQLTGEVRHAPKDKLHGEVFVDKLTLWMRCSVPARVQAVAELNETEPEGILDKDPKLALGVQRGRNTPFRARFVDAFGRTILNASEYWLRWSLTPTSKEGLFFQKAWLNVNKKEPFASIAVPSDATVGATATLRLEVSLPPSSLCVSAATLAALPLPSSDELPLVVARKLELRWPGHPHRARFAMFRNLSIVLEAGFGTGRAQLEILSGHDILEVLEPQQICGEPGFVEPCVPAKALWVGSPCNATRSPHVQRWFLLPTAQGTASLALWDPDLLGARPQPLEVTLRMAKQLDVGLLDEETPADGSAVLVVRGQHRPLRVDVRDAEGQALGVVNWEPLKLKLRSSDPGAFEVKRSPTRCGEYECVCHTPGVYRLSAEMQDYPNGTIYSRILPVQCLPSFDVVLKRIVVMPGQAFDLAFSGGPPRFNDRTFFDYVSSSPQVASIDEDVGLVTALSPGEADVYVRLHDRSSGREIARAGAHVTVTVPNSASIGGIHSLAGAEPGLEPAPALLKGSEALRLRARLWSGSLELTPLLLGLAASKAAPATMDERSRRVLNTALDMGETVVEATEAATQAALHQALSEGLVHSEASNAAAAFGVSCDYHWTADPSVVLEPVGSGVLAVDLRSADGPQQVEVAVVASCPLGRGRETVQLQAKATLPVLPSLQLWSPLGVPCPGASRILVPLHGRVPLAFSMPRSQLKVDILGGSAVQLLEAEDVVELEAGLSEGESALQVQAFAAPQHILTLQVAVSARKAFAARIDAIPPRLPLSASAWCPLYLVDATGQTLTIASNFQVEPSSSLTSVATAEVQAIAGGAALHIRAIGEGCTMLSVTVQLPDERRLPSDIAELCVVRGALVGHGPLLLQPGARLNLDAEELAQLRGFGARRPPIAFSLRLQRLPSNTRSLEEAAAQVSRDVAAALAEGWPRGELGAHPDAPEVRMVAARWVQATSADAVPSLGVEVDLEVIARELAKAAGRSGELGLLDLAEVMQGNFSTETLRLLDLSWGMRGIASEAIHAQDRRCQGCCVPLAQCRSCCDRALRLCGDKAASSVAGWYSTHPHLLAVEGQRVSAIAREPGLATLHYCDGVVSADIQVQIARPGQLMAESPEVGPSDLLSQRNISNEAHGMVLNAMSTVNSSDLRVKFRAFREGGALEADDELRSSPFLAQNLQLQCEPTEAAMQEFFKFKANRDSCVLEPRLPSGAALHRLAPQQIGLRASLNGSSSRGATLEWPFLPRFVVVQAEAPLSPRQPCATLTTSHPSATVLVWTGGYHIEASLEGQIRSWRRGNLSLEVAPSREPRTSIRITWHGAVEWDVPEEVPLRISMASGQVETCRVRIEPSQVPCSPDAGGWSLLEMLFILLAMAALLWLLLRMCARPPPQHGIGDAFQGVGAGPVFGGDPFGGPHAVSPFRALG